MVTLVLLRVFDLEFLVLPLLFSVKARLWRLVKDRQLMVTLESITLLESVSIFCVVHLVICDRAVLLYNLLLVFLDHLVELKIVDMLEHIVDFRLNLLAKLLLLFYDLVLCDQLDLLCCLLLLHPEELLLLA